MEIEAGTPQIFDPNTNTSSETPPPSEDINLESSFIPRLSSTSINTSPSISPSPPNDNLLSPIEPSIPSFSDPPSLPDQSSQLSTPFFIVPLPNGFPPIPLKTDKTELGRSLLTKLRIMASNNPKKMSVSRLQLELTVKGDKVNIKMCGLNKMYVQKAISKQKLWLSKDQECSLQHGDVFTLYGDNFPFQLRHIPSKKPDRGWIGKRVQVYWTLERQWFKGKVIHYDENYDEYKIQYDDGDVTWELAEELILLDEKSPPSLSSSSSSSSSTSKKRVLSKKTDRGPHKKRALMTKSNENIPFKSDISSAIPTSPPSLRRSSRTKEVSYYDWTSSESENEMYDGRAVKVPEYKEDAIKYTETVLQKHELSPYKTAVLYNEACLLHMVPKSHRETPYRLQSITEGLYFLQKKYPENLDIVTDFPIAQRSIISVVHDENYLYKLEHTEHTDEPKQIFNETNKQTDMDTYMSKFSLQASYTAVGAVIYAVHLMALGKYRNIFCAVRPPGHHCGQVGTTEGASTQGYCIFNNVAIGALHAAKQFPNIFEKIAIVDFDVHHGNGTEEILSNDPRFLFISIHVGEIFPFTGIDGVERAPNVINIPLKFGSGSTEFQTAFDVIIPELKKFHPDLLLLSCGFDGHRNDPTGALLLTEKDYFQATEKLKDVAQSCCGGKIISVLEGGYNLLSLRRCATEHVIALMKK